MSDLISRQDAIDALDKLCDMECEYSKKQRSVMCGACHLGTAFDVIEELPSAQPEQKKGKWMPSSLTWSYYNYDCSVCGCNEFRQVDHNGGYKAFNFCPNCGADMREVKE